MFESRPPFGLRSRYYVVAVLLALSCVAPRSADAQIVVPREITAGDVQESIDRAIAYLKSQQKPDGTWPDRPGYAGGLTPLCTLALLNAGCTVEDDAVKRALAYLRRFRSNATYTTSLQTMVFCAAQPEADRLLIQRNIKWLESRQVKSGAEVGMWAIPAPRSPDHVDNSMTHMAMLALYEAERIGISATADTWKRGLDFWRRTQNEDGSWGWGPGYPGTGSMTTAGIACTIIASGQLATPDATVVDGQVQCCGQGTSNDSVHRALQWLERHFSVTHNPGANYWLSYYLYSLERAGRLTARRFIGQHDWFREGAHMLVHRQQSTGAWPSDLDEEYRGDPTISTAFSLMFLAKARRPILLARIEHGKDDDWNHHRRSLYNLVEHVERAWQRPLAYQVIDIRRATVEELLETPVLFLSGSRPPQFTTEEKEKLRMYLDRGGFLFAEACCGGKFDAGFRALVRELFPESEAQLRLLPPNHPVWYAEKPVAPDQVRELFGLDVGCRTSVVYAPSDLSCYWELGGTRRGDALPETVQRQVEAAETIATNVLAYATGRELKYKDPAAPVPAAEELAGPTDRSALRVANVLHPGGCDAAPRALSNLLRLAGEKLPLAAGARASQVKLSDPALFNHHLVLMHGRTGFTLTPLERENLRTYLERGGMLLADAVCSNRAFAESFARELAEIFPDKRLERVPADHPLFTTAFGGDELKRVNLRKSKQQENKRLTLATQEAEPHLESLAVGDRIAVIFSPYDISCALDGHQSLQCEGYTTADAARIALNVLLYSFHQ